jgi:hypothetical protein
LSLHSSATAIPISTESRKIMRDSPPIHGTYIWIEDVKESLNLALVRNGYYGAHALIDMVETRQQFAHSMKAPAMSAARTIMAQERADELAPQRLITDQDYKSKMEGKQTLPNKMRVRRRSGFGHLTRSFIGRRRAMSECSWPRATVACEG